MATMKNSPAVGFEIGSNDQLALLVISGTDLEEPFWFSDSMPAMQQLQPLGIDERGIGF